MQHDSKEEVNYNYMLHFAMQVGFLGANLLPVITTCVTKLSKGVKINWKDLMVMLPPVILSTLSFADYLINDDGKIDLSEECPTNSLMQYVDKSSLPILMNFAISLPYAAFLGVYSQSITR